RYLEDTLATLSPGAKEVVAEAFRYMVTPTGRKIAQTTTDLKKNLLSYLAVGGNSLEDVLSGLRAARLLRQVPPPGGSLPGETCYEFAHDMVAKAAFEWRKQFHQAQKLAEASKREEESRRAQAERERAEDQLHRAVMASHVRLTLSGHSGPVYSVAWSPDGKRLATGSYDKTAKVWDAEAGKELLTLGGHRDRVWSVAWSPDGKRLATGSGEIGRAAWGGGAGKEVLAVGGNSGGVDNGAWSREGKGMGTESGEIRRE